MSDHITITGRSGDDANLPAVLRGYVERFELTSPMVKQMMLDAAAEIERLNAIKTAADKAYRYHMLGYKEPEEFNANVMLDLMNELGALL